MTLIDDTHKKYKLPHAVDGLSRILESIDDKGRPIRMCKNHGILLKNIKNFIVEFRKRKAGKSIYILCRQCRQKQWRNSSKKYNLKKAIEKKIGID